MNTYDKLTQTEAPCGAWIKTQKIPFYVWLLLNYKIDPILSIPTLVSIVLIFGFGTFFASFVLFQHLCSVSLFSIYSCSYLRHYFFFFFFYCSFFPDVLGQCWSFSCVGLSLPFLPLSTLKTGFWGVSSCSPLNNIRVYLLAFGQLDSSNSSIHSHSALFMLFK